MNFDRIKRLADAFESVKWRLEEHRTDCKENLSFHESLETEWDREAAEKYNTEIEIYNELIMQLDKLFKAKL